jgi:hypothetical protein
MAMEINSGDWRSRFGILLLGCWPVAHSLRLWL